MKIDFPRNDIPPEAVMPHYQFLVDTHMRFEQKQAKQEFSYLKYAGLFAIASFAFIVMQNKGIIVDYLPGIISAGVGVLFAMAMRMLFFSIDLDRKLALHVKEGTELEEKCHSVIGFCYFAAIGSVKRARFRGAIASRLFPFAFVGLLTIAAVVALAWKVDIGLAITLGMAAVVLMTISIFFLKKCINNNQLLN